MRNKIELKDYVFQDGMSTDEIWLYYNHIAHENNSDTFKVHLSVLHDIDTINKAQALILPILAKYNVRMFKTQNTDLLSMHQNLDGKEFCIYMQTCDEHSPESKQEFWMELLNEIETTLVQHEISKNPNGALGDLPFPGSQGYVYYRNPHNVGNEYVDAITLMDSGFTRHESCNISTNDFFKGYALKGEEVNSSQTKTSEPLKFKLPVRQVDREKQLKQSILESFHNQLKNNNNLLKLFLGTSGSPYSRNGRLCDRLFGTKLSRDKKFRAFEQARSGALDLVGPFTNYFDRAADKLAQIALILENNGYTFDAHKLGNVLPALYFKFYTPLYLENHNKYPVVIELSESDTEALVTEIIRCSLRDVSKVAIDYELPQYINNMNEADISMLLSFIGIEHPRHEHSAEIKEHVIDIEPYREAYNELINKLSTVFTEHGKEKDEVASTLIQRLTEEAKFFDRPTAEQLGNFIKNCKDSINSASKELKKESDLWSAIHPVLKGILGVLAAITLIPALVTAAVTKNGFVGTFFNSPEPVSTKKLSEIEADLTALEEDIKKRIN
ncbi:hypothetical protein [Legionella worsleiensis]|uniref:Coiled-coil protein n=1 Tax=Legionella worsleiensis TaxID=45076 RepID=A0A0W1AAB3_9GAMM|nr:hypothetical protein [Legionella worsleiensis]KTD78293.1 coiled-coil protein [Legionella worsleiensis]STY32630.1 coiled-coil protein [Legionella worsleiensis]